MTRFKRVGPGLLLGASLSFIGFGDYTELNAMFTLHDPRLWLTFGVGAVLSGLVFSTNRARFSLDKRPLNPGTVVGSVLFGLGWVITGACPGIVFVQLAEGRLPALISLAGIVLGAALFGRLKPVIPWENE